MKRRFRNLKKIIIRAILCGIGLGIGCTVIRATFFRLIVEKKYHVFNLLLCFFVTFIIASIGCFFVQLISDDDIDS